MVLEAGITLSPTLPLKGERVGLSCTLSLEGEGRERVIRRCADPASPNHWVATL
jgi:hypothetical protein